MSCIPVAFGSGVTTTSAPRLQHTTTLAGGQETDAGYGGQTIPSDETSQGVGRILCGTSRHIVCLSEQTTHVPVVRGSRRDIGC